MGISTQQESTTLLGTLTTTSGSTQTLSGLNLTPYKFLLCALENVSSTGTSAIQMNGVALTTAFTSSGNGKNGFFWVNLNNGIAADITEDLATSGAVSNASGTHVGRVGTTNSSTSIAFSIASGTFDLGAIYVYGIK